MTNISLATFVGESMNRNEYSVIGWTPQPPWRHCVVLKISLTKTLPARFGSADGAPFGTDHPKITWTSPFQYKYCVPCVFMPVVAFRKTAAISTPSVKHLLPDVSILCRRCAACVSKQYIKMPVVASFRPEKSWPHFTIWVNILMYWVVSIRPKLL